MISMHAFRDELTKIATVPGPMKAYRRVLTGFEKARRSTRGTPDPATAGFAIHGTRPEKLPSLLSSGKIKETPPDSEQYGIGGTFFWKGHPRNGYMSSPRHEGILTDLETIPNKLAPQRSRYTGKVDPHALQTREYELRNKDTAVIDTAARRLRGELPQILASAKQRRLRVVDSKVFDQARKNHVQSNRYRSGVDDAEPPVHPTKQFLVRASRVKP